MAAQLMAPRTASRVVKQNTASGLAIRDDGTLVPSTPRILAQPNIRPYHGDPRATLQERLRYLAGFVQRRPVVGLEPFNMRKATKEEILQFMDEEYGVQLDARGDEDTVRAAAVAHIRAEQAEDQRRAELAMAMAAERGTSAGAEMAGQQQIAGATDPMALPAGAKVVAGGVISGDAAATEAARAAAARDLALQQAASDRAAELAKQERDELATSRAARRAGGIKA